MKQNLGKNVAKKEYSTIGFTLIELLAVIVILAVIALIATPMIVGVIETSRITSAIRSADGYVTSVERYYLDDVIITDQLLPESVGELNDLVTVQGSKPSKGYIKTDENGLATSAVLCMNHYYVTYDGTNSTVDKSKSCDDIETIPNRPMLLDNMIPVVYENENWVKANVREWYDYGIGKWANAVTVKETNRGTLLSSEPGTVIPMEDINLMFVWVPRYEYKIEEPYGKGGTSASPGEIEVKFIEGKNTKASKDYRVHSGFKFGDTELSGFWVGKFEPGRIRDLENDDPNNVIEIKPNLNAWRNHRIATTYVATRRMELAGNPYGFSQSGTEYGQDGSIVNDSNQFDTRMMKNMEWGAVAYLSQSKYGKYGNSAYTGINKEVYANNYKEYQTGCSSGLPNALSSDTCAYTYEVDLLGTGASTTGTIYGVYDMNGGSEERMMGVLLKENEMPFSGRSDSQNSGFNGPLNSGGSYTQGVSFPQKKYYDLYVSSNEGKACNGGRCYGDATTETWGWYSDYSGFVMPEYPWFLRGGNRKNGATSGIFSSASDSGAVSTYYSFRVVLSEI